MDVFKLRNRLIEDYSAYIESFISIQDDRISRKVEAELSAGALWPDPLIQLNPNFEPGEWIDELADQGALHSLTRKIFRLDKPTNPIGKPMRLHKHQSDAVTAARTGDNYVLTTGTGSGKSLAYIVPIVDHVLRRGSGKGIHIHRDGRLLYGRGSGDRAFDPGGGLRPCHAPARQRSFCRGIDPLACQWPTRRHASSVLSGARKTKSYHFHSGESCVSRLAKLGPQIAEPVVPERFARIRK